MRRKVRGVVKGVLEVLLTAIIIFISIIILSPKEVLKQKFIGAKEKSQNSGNHKQGGKMFNNKKIKTLSSLKKKDISKKIPKNGFVRAKKKIQNLKVRNHGRNYYFGTLKPTTKPTTHPSSRPSKVGMFKIPGASLLFITFFRSIHHNYTTLEEFRFIYREIERAAQKLYRTKCLIFFSDLIIDAWNNVTYREMFSVKFGKKRAVWVFKEEGKPWSYLAEGDIVGMYLNKEFVIRLRIAYEMKEIYDGVPPGFFIVYRDRKRYNLVHRSDFDIFILRIMFEVSHPYFPLSKIPVKNIKQLVTFYNNKYLDVKKLFPMYKVKITDPNCLK